MSVGYKQGLYKWRGALFRECGGGFTGDAGILVLSRAFFAIMGAGPMQKCRLCRFNKKQQVVHDY